MSFSALRTVRQLTVASSRLRLCAKPALRVSLAAARPAASRAFTASAQALKSTPASIQLAERLGGEIKYEADSEKVDFPEFLAAFVEVGTWGIADTPGNDEVFLTRTFGDEHIRVMFSIADLQGLEDEEEGDALDAEGNPVEKDDPLTELRVVLHISKPSHPGALSADLYCANGTFQVASWGFYPSARVATDLSIESDFARRTVYTGPLFEALDPTLQDHFEAFLRERGVDDALAAFVPEYAQWKEQREYVQWLKNVESFVKA
ncbi:mitochondrial glycoprotein [Mycena galopus ATCC 62051]|nr:mitochondrial glycoprotein [Mycena galopus ATCC 62051]